MKKTFVESTRDFVSEWTVTILILLFGTTTLMQAFVVPTSSMESTVLVGDHMIVDKLSYAPGGTFSSISCLIEMSSAGTSSYFAGLRIRVRITSSA